MTLSLPQAGASCSSGCCAHSDPRTGNTSSAGCGCTHELAKDELTPLLIRTLIAGVLVAISITVELGLLQPPGIAVVTSLAALALTAYPILKEAVVGLRNGERNVCELASLAIIGAVLIGEFTAAAEIAIILTIGELIETYAYARTKRDLESIVADNPRFATIIREGTPVQVQVEEIQVSDQVMVKPGDKVPVDGIIIEGHSSLDESCLTGESLPQAKGPGNAVFSGSVNQEGAIIMQATKGVDDSTYAKIVQLVHDAGLRRPPSHPLIDRFSRVYTPIMLLIAGIVLVLTGSYLRAITVLIVACPCALLLATPSAVLASLGAAAKQGILIKGGEYLELCHAITTVVLDKTGTLTSGTMTVTAVIPADSRSEDTVLGVAARAEAGSSHPVAKAIVLAAQERQIPVPYSAGSRNHPGLGVADLQNGKQVFVGNAIFMQENGVIIPEPVANAITSGSSEGSITVLVAEEDRLIGTIYLADQIRPETPGVISRLHSLGITSIHLLTGDSEGVALRIARSSGIPPEVVHAGMHPGDKEEFIAGLQKKGAVVCYVGDGTNDGPALARADLGVSIGSREDTIALETSQVILMQGNLTSLPAYIALGKRARLYIMGNICVALILNALLILAAGAGMLSPAMGAIGHQVATVIVLLNSSRLALK